MRDTALTKETKTESEETQIKKKVSDTVTEINSEINRDRLTARSSEINRDRVTKRNSEINREDLQREKVR